MGRIEPKIVMMDIFLHRDGQIKKGGRGRYRKRENEGRRRERKIKEAKRT